MPDANFPSSHMTSSLARPLRISPARRARRILNSDCSGMPSVKNACLNAPLPKNHTKWCAEIHSGPDLLRPGARRAPAFVPLPRGAPAAGFAEAPVPVRARPAGEAPLRPSRGSRPLRAPRAAAPIRGSQSPQSGLLVLVNPDVAAHVRGAVPDVEHDYAGAGLHVARVGL